MGLMILVSGGTGFIGQVMIRQLINNGYPVRILIQPSLKTPKLPKGMPMDVVVASITDLAGVRAAMNGVDTVIHLVTGENRGSSTDLLKVDVDSARIVSRAAGETGVRRIIYISHLGADRASAFPVLKAKGVSENFIRTSGASYTIIRSSLVYGPNDHLTSGLQRLIQVSPFIFLLPGDGNTMLQPIWVEDLVGCVMTALTEEDSQNRVYEIGGSDLFSIQEIVQMIQDKIGVHKKIVHLHPAYLRILTVIFEHAFKNFAVSTFWLDYLAVNRTCAIDSLPREFGILPSRFTDRIDYLTASTPRKSLQIRTRSSE